MLFGMFYFAGLRTSELRCLRWKHINFINIDPLNVEESTVSVSIEEGWANRVLPQDRDKYESVRGKGYLKNENARRIIPIKGYYALDLDEYNTYFKNLYKTEDIDEYLLFPAKRNKNKLIGETTIDDNLKLRHKNIIDEVEEFSKKDFRASCADRMRVQGYTYEQLLDFFGHEDSDMLKKVYKRGDAQHNYEILDKTLKPDAFGVQSQNEHIEKVFGKKENEE